MATTWNPSDKGANVTLSGGNLGAVTAVATSDGVRATAGKTAGKWYFEVTLGGTVGSASDVSVGVADASWAVSGSFLGGNTHGIGYRGDTGGIIFNNASVGSGAAWATGDVIGVAFDVVGGTVDFYRNNVHVFQATAGQVPVGSTWYPAFGGQGSSSHAYTSTADFGATTLAYTPPSGYSPFDGIDRSGTSVATRQNITAAGAGITSSGLSAAALQNIVAAGTGVNTSGQSVAARQNIIAAGATLPVVASTQTLQAIVVGPALPVGASAKALPAVVAAGAGYAYQGSFLPAIIATGTGSESQNGFSAQTLKGVIAAGQTAITATSSAVLGAPVASASQGVEGSVGVSAASRQPLSAAGAGTFFAAGRSALALPAISAASRGYLGTGATFSAVVMHTESQALWTYTNFVFNSFARFNGQILAGSDGGLFQLAGDNDNGVAIDASARVGITDFNTSHLKRVERVYLGYRSAGEMILRVRTDETNVRDYLVPRSTFSGLHGNHVKLGRGLDARYWQFEVRNRNGSDFSLNMLECKPIVLKRRIGRDDA